MSKLLIVADKFEIVSLHSSGSIDISINSTPEVDLDIKEWEWVNKENDEEVYESLTTLTRSLSICVGKGGRNKIFIEISSLCIILGEGVYINYIK